MTPLSEQSCVACKRGAPLATEAEITQFMPQIPDWNIVEIDGIRRLHRRYRFDNFTAAMAFANRIGELAEAEFHHPAILIEWGKVELTWWSHKIKGLHVNDFVMAAKSDALYPQHDGGS